MSLAFDISKQIGPEKIGAVIPVPQINLITWAKQAEELENKIHSMANDLKHLADYARELKQDIRYTFRNSTS